MQGREGCGGERSPAGSVEKLGVYREKVGRRRADTGRRLTGCFVVVRSSDSADAANGTVSEEGMGKLLVSSSATPELVMMANVFGGPWTSGSNTALMLTGSWTR